MWCREGKQRAERNTTYRVFTDLSGLATCDYSLVFNRPIKVFMERRAFAAGGLAQCSSRLSVLVCLAFKHFHSKVNCAIITTSVIGLQEIKVDRLNRTQLSKGRGHCQQIWVYFREPFIVAWSRDFRDTFCGAVKVRIKASKYLQTPRDFLVRHRQCRLRCAVLWVEEPTLNSHQRRGYLLLRYEHRPPVCFSPLVGPNPLVDTWIMGAVITQDHGSSRVALLWHSYTVELAQSGVSAEYSPCTVSNVCTSSCHC